MTFQVRLLQSLRSFAMTPYLAYSTWYEWLGGKDSNLDKQIQSLPSYRWTTPQEK